MVCELLTLLNELGMLISAEASLPKTEDNSPAFVGKGVKRPPRDRERARIELSILNLGSINTH